MMTDHKRSEKHEEARNTLPDQLKPVFDELVADYAFATITPYGQGWSEPNLGRPPLASPRLRKVSKRWFRAGMSKRCP